jgi:hypothetical protein
VSRSRSCQRTRRSCIMPRQVHITHSGQCPRSRTHSARRPDGVRGRSRRMIVISQRQCSLRRSQLACVLPAQGARGASTYISATPERTPSSEKALCATRPPRSYLSALTTLSPPASPTRPFASHRHIPSTHPPISDHHRHGRLTPLPARLADAPARARLTRARRAARARYAAAARLAIALTDRARTRAPAHPRAAAVVGARPRARQRDTWRAPRARRAGPWDRASVRLGPRHAR